MSGRCRSTPWLRQLAADRLNKAYRRHLHAGKRDARREEAPLPDKSALELAQRLLGRDTSPSNRLARQEVRERVRAALAQLPERDREVLVLRYLEQLTPGQIADVLGVGEGAVRTRHTRALLRLQALLSEEEGEA